MHVPFFVKVTLSQGRKKKRKNTEFYILQSLLWSCRQGHESIPRKPPAEFVKGREMKHSQQVEVNHTEEETEREGSPPEPHRGCCRLRLGAASSVPGQTPAWFASWLAGAARGAAGDPGAVPPNTVLDTGKTCPSTRCQKRSCERPSVSVCMFVHAPLRAEGERGVFPADPGNLASFYPRISARTLFHP